MLADDDRSRKPIASVVVSEGPEGSGEYYSVGYNGVTEIKWGKTAGPMSWLLTLQVFKGDAMASEHLFWKVSGVYYKV